MANESHTQMPTETRQTCEPVRQARHKIIGNGGKYMEIHCLPCLNGLAAPQLQPTVLQEGRFTTARPFIFFQGKTEIWILKTSQFKKYVGQESITVVRYWPWLWVCNLCVMYVAEDVKASGVRTASSRNWPGVWSVCSLQPINILCLFPAWAFGHPVLTARKLCGFSFMRMLIPFIRVSPSWPNHLPKPHIQIPSHWGLDFKQHVNLGRQSIAVWNHVQI